MSQTEPDATEADDTGPTFANPGELEQSLKRGEQEQRERSDELSKHEAQKRRLQQKREEKTVTVRIDGSPTKFSPLSGKESDWIDDLAGEYAGVEEEDMNETEYDEYVEMRERITEMLADHAKNPVLDYDFWADTYPIEDRQRFVGKLKQGGEEAQERDGFR